MRIAVFGSPHVGGIPDEFAGTKPGEWVPNHSISSSSVGLVEGFKRHGFDSYIAGLDGVGEADAVFVCEWNFLRLLVDSGKWDFKKPTIIWLHHTTPGKGFTGQSLIQMSKAICFTRKEAQIEFAIKHGSHHYWHAAWAYPEWWNTPPAKPDPYDHQFCNVVYAGRCAHDSRMPEYIRRLTAKYSDVRVHIVSDVDMLTHDSRNAKIVADFESNPQVNFLGSQIHGTFLNYIYYADLALDTGIIPSRIANNCKIWDYLAMGVPVVTNYDTGGMELIKKTGNGIVAPGFDVEDWLAAFEEARGRDFPRLETIDFMSSNHTWQKVIDGWIPELKKALK